MNKLSKLISAPALGAVLAGAMGIANAAPVTFTNFSSSEPDRFVVPGGALSDPTNIVTLPLLGFSAHNDSATDTLSFTINAAPGDIIREVILHEEGSLDLDGTGLANASGQITVNGISKTAGSFFVFSAGGHTTFTFDNGSLGNLFAFSEADNLTSVLVTITNTIAAGATGPLGGTIEKTVAKVGVVTSPIPLPPAVWMLGSSLVGLIAVGRRKFNV